jgi:signal transduction histidine kinase
VTTSGDHLRVGAHVLIQLGNELVTDVEQAILECVKNSYDADAAWCRIEIDTKEIGTTIETGPSSLRKFTENSETVSVEIFKEGGAVTSSTEIALDETLERRLTYIGRITIEDSGDGLSPEKIRESWLVVSQSGKRPAQGSKKNKTKLGRTPLGDKGLGRLGSMKLGDILRVETSTAPDQPISIAQFRWTDCYSAEVVDEVPVFIDIQANTNKFKGTRVSILGLRELSDWRRQDRINDVTRNLAKLISPFELTSTFPVGISLDGVDHSLITITDELLRRAVAEFTFRWTYDELLKENVLISEAKFQKRLFMSKRNRKLAERTEIVFGVDNGSAFAEFLPTYPRLNQFEMNPVDLDGRWFVTLTQTTRFSAIKPQRSAPVQDPGPFTGAFYFFHLDNQEDPDDSAAASLGINKELVKSMSGIAILRDGFRVRSPGDWLDLSSSMTSGSTYNMRVDNTVGYFSLSGDANYLLTEKSDREGFVEDAVYRGFLAIAMHCKGFANESLEQVRRALDEYARGKVLPKGAPTATTPEGSFRVVEENLRSAREAREEADNIATVLKSEISKFEKDEATDKSGATSRALKMASNAVRAMEVVRSKLEHGTLPAYDLIRLKQDFEIRSEQMVSLLESAAVGLSARGLAHELRTHLTEIRQNVSSIEKLAKKGGDMHEVIISGLRSIRASCGAISNAAALIDPMLPKARMAKQTIELKSLIEDYIKTRIGTLDGAGIRTVIKGAGPTVRANRSRLIQVIDNLVRNGVYWIRRAEAAGEQVRPKILGFDLTRRGFNVWDSGPGVDPRFESSLFEIFVTGKPNQDGQGLGLFIIQQLLQNEGCDVTLLNDRNADGRLYKFSVDLTPLVKA